MVGVKKRRSNVSITNSRFYKGQMPTKTHKKDCATFVITYMRLNSRSTYAWSCIL